MVNIFGESVTLIEFLNTIKFPSVFWIVLFVLILTKMGEIGVNKK